MNTNPEIPAAIRYIPLLPRPRPPALPLQQRISELHDLLERTAATDGLIKASEAMNKAALLASDTGQPAMAERLCWQHYELFTHSAPLPVKTATLALQPLVNLGRLAIRAGQNTTAYQIFDSLFQAVNHEKTAFVNGRTCVVADLVADTPQRAQLRRFLWTVLLADGTRALCGASQWQKALAHVERYNGIGQRLLDGRQVAVIAALQRREPETALQLLEEAHCSELWEQSVAACLATASTRAAKHDPTDAIYAMVRSFTGLPAPSGGAVFAARLGTLACELAPGHRILTNHLIDGAMESEDAYTATVLLNSPVVEAQLSPRQREVLRQRVSGAELADTDLPSSLDEDLVLACERAATHLSHHLQHADPSKAVGTNQRTD